MDVTPPPDVFRVQTPSRVWDAVKAWRAKDGAREYTAWLFPADTAKEPIVMTFQPPSARAVIELLDTCPGSWSVAERNDHYETSGVMVFGDIDTPMEPEAASFACGRISAKLQLLLRKPPTGENRGTSLARQKSWLHSVWWQSAQSKWHFYYYNLPVKRESFRAAMGQLCAALPDLLDPAPYNMIAMRWPYTANRKGDIGSALAAAYFFAADGTMLGTREQPAWARSRVETLDALRLSVNATAVAVPKDLPELPPPMPDHEAPFEPEPPSMLDRKHVFVEAIFRRRVARIESMEDYWSLMKWCSKRMFVAQGRLWVKSMQQTEVRGEYAIGLSSRRLEDFVRACPPMRRFREYAKRNFGTELRKSIVLSHYDGVEVRAQPYGGTLPPGPHDGHYFNAWAGFAGHRMLQRYDAGDVAHLAADPTSALSMVLRFHHEQLCGGSLKMSMLVMCLLREMFMDPDQALTGRLIWYYSQLEGVGKSTWLQLIRLLFGPEHALYTESLDDVTGRFNASSAGKSVLCVDESCPREKDWARLKYVTTSTRRRLERKGVDAGAVVGRQLVFLASNELKVPLGGQDRRTVLCAVAPDMCTNDPRAVEFAKLVAQPDTVVQLACFLRYMCATAALMLLRREVFHGSVYRSVYVRSAHTPAQRVLRQMLVARCNFDPQVVAEREDGAPVRDRGDKPITAYVSAYVVALDPKEGGWATQVQCSVWDKYYRRAAGRVGASGQEIMDFVEVAGGRRAVHPVGGKIVMCYTFPDYETTRLTFFREHPSAAPDFPIDWDTAPLFWPHQVDPDSWKRPDQALLQPPDAQYLGKWPFSGPVIYSHRQQALWLQLWKLTPMAPAELVKAVRELNAVARQSVPAPEVAAPAAVDREPEPPQPPPPSPPPEPVYFRARPPAVSLQELMQQAHEADAAFDERTRMAVTADVSSGDEPSAHSSDCEDDSVASLRRKRCPFVAYEADEGTSTASVMQEE